jgi:isoleucyl-tRNA synthetase
MSLPFEKYEPQITEKNIVSFWEEKEVLTKINGRNKDGKKFYFLQGPPYTSGKLHCGQAWNHSLKDAVLRYKRMNGFSVLARAGYDMHGLPTELKVQAKNNLKHKEDIESFGLDKFAKECIQWSEEKSKVMTADLKSLGITLDFSDPYEPITKDYIDSIWYLVKKADEKKRLYLGEKTMTWCPSCATACAKHELEYKEITDDSIFLKFELPKTKPFSNEDNKKEYLIVWTTTPWTISFNLAIMVNPSMEYVKAKITHNADSRAVKKGFLKEGDVEYWILCKELAGVFLGNVDGISQEIVDTFLGSRLAKMKYIHPWASSNPDINEIVKNSKNVFTVVLSEEYVDASAGTGLVHCAPGCGPEDYEVGIKNKIPPYNSIDVNGAFPERIEKYKGLIAKKDDKKFIRMMDDDGFLILSTKVDHEYAHCDRCSSPVVFRTTKQWFFKTEDLKKKMLSANKKTNWHPETAKNAFNSWLENLRDNSITKQRFWGTPAPIWVHKNKEGEIDEYYVVESSTELEKLAGKSPENMHKPWIDEISFNSPKTGNLLTRIPDVLDVWIDAGCASWASLYYPKRTDLFEQYFPAEYIVEGKDQIRGWYNLLMVASILAFDKPAFKNVGMHGFLTDVDGVKMSKSLGNIVAPQEVISKTSVDNFRYYFSKTKAGEDISFSWEQLQLHQRHLTILWNTARYLQDLAAQTNEPLEKILRNGKKKAGLEEKYILSKANNCILRTTELFETYKIDEIPEVIAELFLAISRNYIQAIRDKSTDSEERDSVIYALFESITIALHLLSPICPFITEMIYQNFKMFEIEPFNEESIHLLSWPKSQKGQIDEKIEKNFETALSIVSGILAAREKAQINIRQPLQKIILATNSSAISEALSMFEETVKSQANIKSIIVQESSEHLQFNVKPKFKAIADDFGSETPKIAELISKLPPEEIKKMRSSFSSKKAHIVDGHSLKEQHIEFIISASSPYILGEIPNSLVLLDTTLTAELLSEGLAREFIRRIQNERKNLGLIKNDRVNITVEKEFYEIIKTHDSQIKQICGISKVDFGIGEIELKIKDKVLHLSINKI